MIKEFPRVPKDIAYSTYLIPSKKSATYEKIICHNCKTLLSDRDNLDYYPYCGSSDIIKNSY